ncbi:hypothetical protein [Shouchella tritolerans]|uniref:hypothetical protein n=1 Tax=Shouchella tritolerans TaxID=2979466 RepID=UPI0021E8E02C|nr:hypothetical protein [Shouchella tritolerans]
MKLPAWDKFDKKVIEAYHGQIDKYRKLYEGEHVDLFPRAQRLIQQGEITDAIKDGNYVAQQVQTPYLVANVSKLIPEIPAVFVSRSLGKVTTSFMRNPDALKQVSSDTDNMIEGTKDDSFNAEIIDLQQELIEQIEKNSNLRMEHMPNIVQQQVDGGLVGCVWLDERGPRIEFKQRDVYYPHDDGLGVDLVYDRKIEDERYLHVYRERVEKEGLVTENILMKGSDGGDTFEPVEEAKAKELLGLKELKKTFKGRKRPFVVYWPNEKTFMNPLGRSCLKGVEGKQDEINWTLTRASLIYERNGKPRIAVSNEVFQRLTDLAIERYGENNPEQKIDHRDLEITTFDENGKAIEVIQIDTSKIGDIQTVRHLMQQVLAETRTSSKAIDYYLGETTGTATAQSGTAKFYDLMTSIIKAEQIQGEYIYFLQQLFENVLWLIAQDDDSVKIEEPDIAVRSMIPIARKDLIEENMSAYREGAQSLETTVRNINPLASEEWIQQELERLEMESTTTNSIGGGSLSNYLDNRDQPLTGGGENEENE